MSDTNSVTTYYPCRDSTREPCKDFVKRGTCKYNMRCQYYHPLAITPTITKKVYRESGKCYCGSVLKLIVKNRAYDPRKPETLNGNNFFMVCARTSKSIKRCL